MSSKNIFQAGVNALSASNSLEKIVIMKQIPRYDPTQVDPMSLKPALSQLFNNTLTDLWMNSEFKDRIIIGNHNIECSGAIKESRYRETKTGRFDGIHLYGSSGRKAYTNSVLNILQCAQLTSSEYEYHKTCPQSRHQDRQNRQRSQNKHRQRFNTKSDWNVYNQQNEFTLPTANRFESLSSKNQGNW